MCRWSLLWVSVTSLVVAIPEEQQYCAVRYRRLCQGKGTHVACQFSDAGPGPSCERYIPIKFSQELKNFVTHYLNRRRQRIAAGNERVRGGVHLPKPQIMMLVEWDRELALLAQRLADQCHFVHDDCRATVRYPYAGQTVGEVRWRRFSDSDELSALRAIRRVLDAWWGERRRVQPKQLTAPFRLTAKGTVWGHFSQLAVWNLRAVGCGAVRHGTHQPRLLLVCDFSHTNMLGQKTLVSGPMASCPIHTARRSRTAYPLLCAPVRHPVATEPYERELEDNNYDDNEEEDHEDSGTDVVQVSQPKFWRSSSERRWLNPKMKPSDKEFSGLKEHIVHNVDRGQKQRIKVQNVVNYKQTPNTFDTSQFENIVRNEWKTRPKPILVQWRHLQEKAGPENSEEVIPLTIPRRVITETADATTEGYRPTINEVVIPHSAEEVYRPTITEDINTSEEMSYRPRWRQTRIRPQRPGANALLTYSSTSNTYRTEFNVQLLPSSIGKRILLYLPRAQLGDYAKVNKYWAYLVDEIRAELAARIKIDADYERLNELLFRHDPSLEMFVPHSAQATQPSSQGVMSALATTTKRPALPSLRHSEKSAGAYSHRQFISEKLTKPVIIQRPIRNMLDLKERLERRGAADENIWKWCDCVLRHAKKHKTVIQKTDDDYGGGVLSLGHVHFPCPLMKFSMKVPLDPPVYKDPIMTTSAKPRRNIAQCNLVHAPKETTKRYSLWTRNLSALYRVFKIPSYLNPEKPAIAIREHQTEKSVPGKPF